MWVDGGSCGGGVDVIVEKEMSVVVEVFLSSFGDGLYVYDNGFVVFLWCLFILFLNLNIILWWVFYFYFYRVDFNLVVLLVYI